MQKEATLSPCTTQQCWPFGNNVAKMRPLSERLTPRSPQPFPPTKHGCLVYSITRRVIKTKSVSRPFDLSTASVQHTSSLDQNLTHDATSHGTKQYVHNFWVGLWIEPNANWYTGGEQLLSTYTIQEVLFFYTCWTMNMAWYKAHGHEWLNVQCSASDIESLMSWHYLAYQHNGNIRDFWTKSGFFLDFICILLDLDQIIWEIYQIFTLTVPEAHMIYFCLLTGGR